MNATRSMSWIGSLRSSSRFTKLNSTLLTPIASARISVTTSVKPGFLTSPRIP